MSLNHIIKPHIAKMTVDQSIQSLNSSLEGISLEEVHLRRKEFGLNQIDEVKSSSLMKKLLGEFTHFFAFILWIAASMALLAEHQNPGEGMMQLSIAIILVILINGVFSFWQEFRAEQALNALRKMLPMTVKVKRKGIENPFITLLAQELVPGDILLLEEGDIVPADVRILEGSNIRVNMSTLTGESLPKSRHSNPCDVNTLLDSKNLLFAGTFLVSGKCKGIVYAIGMKTEFGQIANLTQTTGKSISHLQEEIERLSKWVAIFASTIGVFFFVLGVLIGLPFWSNLMFAIGIIVANVPEGLLPTVTLSLAMATQRMAKRNALIRHLPAVETLGSTTVICSDKTGTLTQNKMSVEKMNIQGEPYWFYTTLLLCHSLKYNPSKKSIMDSNNIPNKSDFWEGDPMEQALRIHAEEHFGNIKIPFVVKNWSQKGEISFDSDRRRMSVISQDHQGKSYLFCKGAPEVLLPLCHLSGIEEHKRLTNEYESMAKEGLRVLGITFRELNGNEVELTSSDESPLLEANLSFLGFVGLVDPPREDVRKAVLKCHSAGIKVIMVTGDHPQTSLSIAKKIGLVRTESPKIVRGDDLKGMTSAQLQMILDQPDVLFSRVSAEQKMIIVSALKNKKHIVAVTGDGVNDAPALKSAHIGIAMGSGSDVAKEASDMVLLDDHFASIVYAVEEGRSVFENIRKFLTYILTSNIPELVPYLAFVIFEVPLPLTIIQILAVDLGTDMIPALALGAEKPSKELMKLPPRSIHERLMSKSILFRSYLWLGLLESAVSILSFFWFLSDEGWKFGQPLSMKDPIYLQATSVCLAAIVLSQMMNVFICRHSKISMLKFSLIENSLLLWGLLIEITLILIIIYTPWGNALFGTHPFEGIMWLKMIPLVLIFGILEELRKGLVRRNEIL